MTSTTAQPPHPGQPLIRLNNVGKVFHADDVKTHALSGIDPQIVAGEFVAITGPSGRGKSTLLSILGLLDEQSTGDYLPGGQSIAGFDRRARAQVRNTRIGFIFQAFNLLGDLTVAENVALPLTYRADYDRERVRHRVQVVLEQVEMAHRANHYPGQLSGGQQQRVAVARAIAGDPTILLADEPSGNLDSRNGESVMQLLETLHSNGSTLCMVTHDPAHARRAQRIAHMIDGRIVEDEIRDPSVLPAVQETVA